MWWFILLHSRIGINYRQQSSSSMCIMLMMCGMLFSSVLSLSAYNIPW